ncbi:stage III sporulation protein AH [Ruminococcus sp. YE71]|uniref:SpoIIIAH-like family protein n=1 Tax=unclassified Ruminococcus TaxID=2608920 RepID=UPI00088974AA|nr:MULTISPECIES: SpoIIIAH-like family protein [unclassified Ruminococcus]SDA17047.1 stage III sporulation protein AH [Ruminococcus sp. YE78]SFW25989.1 stage III sporulation protein AH [Ruminococcus sp. YE71]
MEKQKRPRLSVIIGKRQILLAGMTLVLGTAVYVNYALSASSGGLKTTGKVDSKSISYGDAQLVSADKKASDDYFAKARLDRAESRDKAAETLARIMNGGDSSPEEQQAAAAEAAAMTGLIEKESKVENLIRAAGFTDCVVYLDGENANVVVQTDSGLIQTEAAQIKDILLSEVSVPAEKIRIFDVDEKA